MANPTRQPRPQRPRRDAEPGRAQSAARTLSAENGDPTRPPAYTRADDSPPFGLRPAGGTRRGAPPSYREAQDITTGPPPTELQLIYYEAVERVRALDPVIYDCLRRTRIDAGGYVVRTIEGTSQDTPPVPFRIDFRLNVEHAALPAGAAAQFQPDQLASSVTLGAAGGAISMRMLIDLGRINALLAGGDRAGAVEEMTSDLYHEGIHMLLFMDRMVPAVNQPAHVRGFNTYLAAARARPEFAVAEAGLELFIQNYYATVDRWSAPGNVVRRAVEDIMVSVIEERYAWDQEAAHFAGPTHNETDARLAANYLLNALDQKLTGFGAQVSSRRVHYIRQLLPIVDALVDIFNAIRGVRTPPLSSAPSQPADRPATTP